MRAWGNAKLALLFSLTLLSSAQLSTAKTSNDDGYETLRPIVASLRLHEEGFVDKRCAAFLEAIFLYHMILSNPFVFPEGAAGDIFDWALDLRLDDRLRAVSSGDAMAEVQGYTEEYMKEFGVITHPSPVPNKGLYASDKATCQQEFGNGDE